MLFLVVLFFVKNGFPFINGKNSQTEQANKSVVAYNGAVIGELINRDTDEDGVLDWEEGLWGTDPTKKETTPGINDGVAIEKLKMEQEKNNPSTDETMKTQENLTQTDQFSQDLFTTIAAATQNGQPLDQTTMDKISSSLADHIQNSPQRKVYTLSDLKIASDNSFQAVRKFDYALKDIYTKYPINGDTAQVFSEFASGGDTANADVLQKLSPIIEYNKARLEALAKAEVPQSLAALYLDFLNAHERLIENLSDIQLYSTDSIVALSGTVQYEQNTALLKTAAINLTAAIRQKWQD